MADGIGGCFFHRASCTSFVSGMTLPVPSSVMDWRAACILPPIISLEKDLTSDDSLLKGLTLSCLWMVRPSSIRLLMSPLDYALNRWSRWVEWSLALEFWCGFCSISTGRTIAAFSTTHSKAEPFAYVRKSWVSSQTKDLPALPDGILKRFHLQFTISSLQQSIKWAKALPASFSPHLKFGEAICINCGRSLTFASSMALMWLSLSSPVSEGSSRHMPPSLCVIAIIDIDSVVASQGIGFMMLPLPEVVVLALSFHHSRIIRFFLASNLSNPRRPCGRRNSYNDHFDYTCSTIPSLSGNIESSLYTGIIESEWPLATIRHLGPSRNSTL